MLILEIAGGIVLAVLILAYLPDILAAGAGVLLAIAGIIVAVAIISSGWDGVALAALFLTWAAGAVYFYRKEQARWELDVEVPGTFKSVSRSDDAQPAPTSLRSLPGRRFRFSFSKEHD